jgi:hypothetical protein
MRLCLLGIEDVTERRALEREKEELLRQKDALLREKDVLLEELQHRVTGPVRNVVGIRSGIISGELFIPYYAARSNC